MKKAVASHAPHKQKLTWNAQYLHGEAHLAVAELKKQQGDDILVYGSGMLLQTLMQHNLADEYRLIVYPVILGKGKRLFRAGTTATLTLTKADTTDSGVAILTYHPKVTA